MPVSLVLKYLPQSAHRYLWQRTNRRDGLPWIEILRISRLNESLTRRFSHVQWGQAFLPVHLASNTGGTWLTTFSIAKSRKPINNLSTGPSLLFFGRKIKAALVGIPAFAWYAHFFFGALCPCLWGRAPAWRSNFLNCVRYRSCMARSCYSIQIFCHLRFRLLVPVYQFFPSFSSLRSFHDALFG